MFFLSHLGVMRPSSRAVSKRDTDWGIGLSPFAHLRPWRCVTPVIQETST